ncbi:hypothetical protein ACWEU6_02770 [Streptosporangium sandarakinum]|uniref:hypothetical protein n=1 Tax=Streptosporangium sandarakinum TaxID=1260955 RepID=UPI0036948B32
MAGVTAVEDRTGSGEEAVRRRRPVRARWSMFDSHYLSVYLLVVVIMIFGALLTAMLYLQQRRTSRHNGRSNEPTFGSRPP